MAKHMATIVTENHDQDVVSSTYWGSEYDRGGKAFCSVNAGAVRVLLPSSDSPFRDAVSDLRQAEYAVLSRGPWPRRGLGEAVEIMWEDHTDSPHAWHLSPESFDVMPAEPAAGRTWIIAVWEARGGRPTKVLEKVCHWRQVPRLPWLKPLSR